ncbi:hypothetical protein CH35J_012364 [Colletotrichum higginsianum]|nr:hypothetical protein CH35J_012364 [Colletotrichum higginsianum]
MNPFVADKTTKYDTAEDGPDSESEDHLSWRRNTSSPAVVTVSRAFYFTSLLLFVIFPILAIAIVLLHGKLEAGRIDSGFLQGFPTELDPVKSVLASETVRFTGGLHYHPNGTLYRETIAGEPQYVGAPSPEVDLAWDTLLKGQYMNLNGNEASTMVGRTWKDDSGNYEVALDVMHTLHCVNKIRKALDPEYYHESESPRIHRMHVDHCLDYLRQTCLPRYF